MSRYVITKIDPCGRCFGNGEIILKKAAALPDDYVGDPVTCDRCQGRGEIRTEVDIIEVLRRVSIYGPVPSQAYTGWKGAYKLIAADADDVSVG